MSSETSPRCVALAVAAEADVGRAERLGFESLALAHPAAARARPPLPVAAVGVAGAARACAGDAAERREWMARATAAVERANALECAHVVCDLGRADAVPDAGWADLCDRFARETLDDERVARFVRARASAAARNLDGARRSIERLLSACERQGVALAVRPAARGDELPLADELGALLLDFRGAPLCAWRHVAREHVLAAVRLVRRAAWPDGAGADVADACGTLAGLPPGRGEADLAGALARARGPRVIASPIATDRELGMALSLLRSM